LTYVTEEQRSRTGWIVCQMLVEILADGTSASDQNFGQARQPADLLRLLLPLDICGLQSLRPLGDVKLHRLALSQ